MQSQHPSISAQLQQSISRIQTAFARFKQEALQVTSHSEPIDWCNPEGNECRIWNINVRLPGKLGMSYGLCTSIQYTWHPHKRLPELHWNSEHLAYHLTDNSTYHCGIDYWGQEQEVTEYVARPFWGLLGEHSYSW